MGRGETSLVSQNKCLKMHFSEMYLSLKLKYLNLGLGDMAKIIITIYFFVWINSY